MSLDAYNNSGSKKGRGAFFNILATTGLIHVSDFRLPWKF